MPAQSDGWQFVPELKLADGEPVVHKTYADSFEATDLEEVLAGKGIGRLVVSGAQTDECIRSTLHGAIVRGYDATAGQRRAHDRGPVGVRRTHPGQGHRAHEPVLGEPHGAGPHGGRREDRGRVQASRLISSLRSTRAA